MNTESELYIAVTDYLYAIDRSDYYKGDPEYKVAVHQTRCELEDVLTKLEEEEDECRR
jgi:hypothetical protein